MGSPENVSCSTCKYRTKSANSSPCVSCYKYESWEAPLSAPTMEEVKPQLSFGNKVPPTMEIAHAEIDAAQLEERVLSALNTQVGGGHYKQFPIQPIEFTFKNNLNFLQGNIIKYACRYKDKNGKEDLEKVIHYAQLLIELEYGDA